MRIRYLTLLALIGLSIRAQATTSEPGAHAGGPSCPQVLEGHAVAPQLDLHAFPQRLTMTRYTSPNKNATRALSYQLNEGRFSPENVIESRVVANGSRGSVLRDQQQFALRVGARRLNYTPEKVASLLEIGDQLDHEQVDFFEMRRIVPYQTWSNSQYRDLPETDYEIVSPSSAHPSENLVQIKTASLWSIAGQYVDTKASKIVMRSLPGQLGHDESGKLLFSLDRKKYRFVSEWGRAGQEVDGEFDALFSAAAMSDYKKIRALGGRLEDGWVMLHSNRPANTRGYQGKFPGRLYIPEGTEFNPSNALFLIPLSEMMTLQPPTKYFHRIEKVIEFSEGRLSPQDASTLLDYLAQLRWDEVDFKAPNGHDQGQPLVIRDYSIGLVHASHALAIRAGIPEKNLPAFFTWKRQFRSPEYTASNGQYRDLTVPELAQYLQSKEVVEISNLNDAQAKADPRFIKTVLMASLDYYIQRFYGGKNVPKNLAQELVEKMHNAQVHFAITTRDPAVMAQAEAFHPVEEHTVLVPKYDPIMLTPTEFAQHHRNFAESVQLKTYLFSIKQIVDLVSLDDWYYNRVAADAISHGPWHARYDLETGEPF